MCPIDSNLFYNKNQTREDKILYSGYMHPLKGTFEFFEYVLQNPNLKFVLAGWTDNHCLNFLGIQTLHTLDLHIYCEHLLT